ncbi:CHAT domain-containing protein [Streptomyces sp. SBT349]|uniref:CHAT domain-containing protein n=1 Tax=Streptomyces sp. SBT349 TaxID=1580539 RepID=UPI00066B82A0|nr:CHAT domain-containing protein [Streptomyces sp. SBT349]
MNGHPAGGMRDYLRADTGGPPPSPAPARRAAPPPEQLPEQPPRAERRARAEPEPPPREFEPERVGLNAALPADVAMLRVTGSSWEGRPRLNLSWHHGGSVEVATHEQVSIELPPADLSLARLVAEAAEAEAEGAARPSGARPWQDTYYEVMNWWLPESRLVEWVRELLAARGQPRLVIWDNTPYDIPWELLYHQPSLDAEPSDEGWLGELIPVVRWLSVHDGARSRDWSAEERASEGGLLMLEDERFAEREDSFAPYLVEPRARTVQELMNRLGDHLDPFGLLLIRCHGVYSRATRNFTLGGLSLNEYTDFTMRALRRHRAPVLLNACSSGRTVLEARGPGGQVRSFAELFLRRGACAVIATVGDIDLNHSHDFAVRLLHTTEERRTNLAAVLHAHRRHYARRARRRAGEARDSRTEADFKLFFASFLYVYYGHPDTSLRTLARGAGNGP